MLYSGTDPESIREPTQSRISPSILQYTKEKGPMTGYDPRRGPTMFHCGVMFEEYAKYNTLLEKLSHTT